MRVYYDRDADVNLIKDPGRSPSSATAARAMPTPITCKRLRRQGRGLRRAAAGLGSSIAKAKPPELKVMTPAEAAKWADVVMVLSARRAPGRALQDHLADNLRNGAALAFAHGLVDPLPPDRAPRRPRRLHGSAQGPRPYGALRIPARRRCARVCWRSNRTPPATPTRSALSYAIRHRRRARRHHRDHVQARNARRICSASRSVLCGGSDGV